MRTTILLCSALFSGSLAAQTYYPPLAGNTWETVDPATLGWCTDEIPALIDFLEQSNTKAFIVLKDGRIAIEHYFGTFTQDSLWYWASAGKSLTAFLAGKAQEEGFLDIDETSDTYLGAGWTSCAPLQEEQVTIRHQLTMTTGFDDGVPDPDCTDPACLECLAEPGTRWAYHNAPYTLLDGVITGATGQTLNGYVFNKLTLTTGLQGAYAQLGSNNVFFSKARAMARFGLLCMGQGAWNGNPVMNDQAYFSEMVSPSQSLNPSYGYLWWLNGQSSFMLPGLQQSFSGMLCPAMPADAYSAMGKNGQLCNVSPSTGLVVVRMGDLPGGIFVPNFYNNDIWALLNDVMCTSTAASDVTFSGNVRLWPNPASDLVRLTADGSTVNQMEVRAADGRLLLSASNVAHFDASALPIGHYLMTLRDGSDRWHCEPLVIVR
ncbi:MAG: beta-lactamase family protein [Flavobacteriales bacterium]|nr:beta-lactamase family protein [Flavobacteriales bacterium]